MGDDALLGAGVAVFNILNHASVNLKAVLAATLVAIRCDECVVVVFHGVGPAESGVFEVLELFLICLYGVVRFV